MLKKYRWLLEWSIFAVLTIAWLSWQNRHLLDDDGSVIIASQKFVDTQGAVVNLQASDKKTLLYFFAPWCTVCDLSIGNLAAVDEDEYTVLRVALDYQSVQEVQAFLDKNDIQQAALLGNNTHKARFNIKGYPSYYLLDQDLTVIGSDMGYSSSIGLRLRTLFNK